MCFSNYDKPKYTREKGLILVPTYVWLFAGGIVFITNILDLNCHIGVS